MRGVPQGEVGDVGTLPAKCSWLEEEQPKVNGEGGWITIGRMRKGGEVGFLH